MSNGYIIKREECYIEQWLTKEAIDMKKIQLVHSMSGYNQSVDTSGMREEGGIDKAIEQSFELLKERVRKSGGRPQENW